MNTAFLLRYKIKVFSYLFCVIPLFSVLSCSRTNDIQFESYEDGFLVYNYDDSLKFDQNWDLTNSTVSFNDSISLASFENDSLTNIHNLSNDVIWVDSQSNPLYIEKDFKLNQSLGTNIQYRQDSLWKELIINFTFIIDQHIKAFSIDQYLIFKNNKIDTSRSSFYIIEELNNRSILKIFNRQDVDEDYYYQVIYYTNPFLELSPANIAGNLYVEDTAKRKDILYFRKGQDPIIPFYNPRERPKVFQIYVFKVGTTEPLHYRLGVVRTAFSSGGKLTTLKNELNEKLNQFKNKKYLEDVEKSLEPFPFLNIKSKGVVELDKDNLIKLYSKYKSEE